MLSTYLNAILKTAGTARYKTLFDSRGVRKLDFAGQIEM